MSGEKFKDSGFWDGETERRRVIRVKPPESCTGSCAQQLEQYVTSELSHLRAGQYQAFKEMLTEQTAELKQLIESAYPDGADNHRKDHQTRIDDAKTRAEFKQKLLDKALTGLVSIALLGVGFVGKATWEAFKHEVTTVEAKK